MSILYISGIIYDDFLGIVLWHTQAILESGDIFKLINTSTLPWHHFWFCGTCHFRLRVKIYIWIKTPNLSLKKYLDLSAPKYTCLFQIHNYTLNILIYHTSSRFLAYVPLILRYASSIASVHHTWKEIFTSNKINLRFFVRDWICSFCVNFVWDMY